MERQVYVAEINLKARYVVVEDGAVVAEPVVQGHAGGKALATLMHELEAGLTQASAALAAGESLPTAPGDNGQ